MNKIFKGVMLSLLAMAGLASCGDDYDYTAATAPTGAQVFFPVSNETSYTLVKSDETQVINIPIQRANNSEAISVGLQLTVAQNADVFSIPSQVSFAAGESTAIVPLSYNSSTLEYDTSDTLLISIADNSYTTDYGVTTYKCIVSLPSPMKLLGTGKWTDYYMFEVEDVDVEIYQNELNPNVFRVMLNYEDVLKEAGGEANGLQSAYTDITLLKVGDDLQGVTISQPDMVYFTPFDMGYANSTGEMVAYHPVDFSPSWERFFPTSYVDQYQENGLPGVIMLSGLILVDFEGGRGWAPCQSDEPIAIITFPGYEAADYTAELSYSGIFTDATSNIFAVGNLTLGEDAKTVKAAVVSASDDAAAVADAIAAGDLEAVNVAAGRIEVPIAEGQTGKLQIVVVVLDGDKVKTVSSAKFEYYGGNKNPWESLGTGIFIDDCVVSLFGYDPEPYYVEVEESNETPGLYRLVEMYADVVADFGEDGGHENIEVHAEDPEGVYILQQPIGWDAGYGDMSLLTEGGRYVAANGFDVVKQVRPDLLGTLKNGVITFPIFAYSNGIYQCFINMGGSNYYAGTNGAFEIYLPEALESDASLKAKALSRAKAASFEKRLNAYKKVSSKQRAFSMKIMKKLAKAF